MATVASKSGRSLLVAVCTSVLYYIGLSVQSGPAGTLKGFNQLPIHPGYCVEFAQKLAELMKIDYDLILPTDNSEDFGIKTPDGNWTGLIGINYFRNGSIFSASS